MDVVKSVDLTLIRGDTSDISFELKAENGESYILGSNDKLYFTVKHSFYDKEFIFQKTNKDGITYNQQTDEYEVHLTQDCTCDLPCSKYAYDIKVVLNGEDEKFVKTLVKGYIKFDINATHKENEQ